MLRKLEIGYDFYKPDLKADVCSRRRYSRLGVHKLLMYPYPISIGGSQR
jgi:hypothetical protein